MGMIVEFWIQVLLQWDFCTVLSRSVESEMKLFLHQLLRSGRFLKTKMQNSTTGLKKKSIRSHFRRIWIFDDFFRPILVTGPFDFFCLISCIGVSPPDFLSWNRKVAVFLSGKLANVASLLVLSKSIFRSLVFFVSTKEVWENPDIAKQGPHPGLAHPKVPQPFLSPGQNKNFPGRKFSNGKTNKIVPICGPHNRTGRQREMVATKP